MENLNFITVAHEWALGIPLGWVPPSSSDKSGGVIGNVLFQDHIIPLDKVAYAMWSDALVGGVDFSRCGESDYLPPALAIEKHQTGKTATPQQITDAALHLSDSGLIWHFDPMGSSGYSEAEGFEVAVQGVPFGHVPGTDRYRIEHTDGSPALEIDGVAYMVWLQWWREPSLVKAARAVADDLGIRRLDVVGRAVGTLTAGMRAGLLYIAKTRKA